MIIYMWETKGEMNNVYSLLISIALHVVKSKWHPNGSNCQIKRLILISIPIHHSPMYKHIFISIFSDLWIISILLVLYIFREIFYFLWNISNADDDYDYVHTTHCTHIHTHTFFDHQILVSNTIIWYIIIFG